MNSWSTGTTRYLLDGMSVIAQYGTDGARQAWYTQSLARIDEVLNVVNGVGKYWYQTDALGSVYALTTQAGEIRARGGYDVFGESVALSGTAVGQPFGFTGREHEADSGLVYARARYLQPGMGRWTAADPLRFINGPSRYAYSKNAPTRFTDPRGLYITGIDPALRQAWSKLDESAIGLHLKEVVQYSYLYVAIDSAINISETDAYGTAVSVGGRTGNGYGEQGFEKCVGDGYHIVIRIDIGFAERERATQYGYDVPGLDVFLASTIAHELVHVEQGLAEGIGALQRAAQQHTDALRYLVLGRWGAAAEDTPSMIEQQTFNELMGWQ